MKVVRPPIRTTASRLSWIAATVAGLLLAASLIATVPTLAEKKSDAVPLDAVPAKFLPLYKELQKTLLDDRRHYSFKPNGAVPRFAPVLYMANSSFSAFDSEEDRWRDIITTLDACKRLGTDTVSVTIYMSDLCTDDSKPMIEFYKRLVKEVHARKMKLFVDNLLVTPSGTSVVEEFQDQSNGKELFMNMLVKELSMIYMEVKPDFLCMLSEPESLLKNPHLSLTTGELSRWLGALCTTLKKHESDQETLLGAGESTWEAEDIGVKFAGQEDLDFIDFRVRPLKMGESNSFIDLALRIEEVREVDQKMMVTITDAWLYKHGASEPGVLDNSDSLQRDNYSFWAPLDEHYLRFLAAVSQKENIPLITLRGAQYLFTSYDYDASDAKKLPPWPQSAVVSWKKALDAMRKQELSQVGTMLKALLSEN